MNARSLQSCVTLCHPWTVASQAPLSMAFSRQRYLSGLPCPPPGRLPHPGISYVSCNGKWFLYHQYHLRSP